MNHKIECLFVYRSDSPISQGAGAEGVRQKVSGCVYGTEQRATGRQMHPVRQMSGSTFHHQAKAGAQAHGGLTEKGVAGRSRLRLLDTWGGSKASPTPPQWGLSAAARSGSKKNQVLDCLWPAGPLTKPRCVFISQLGISISQFETPKLGMTGENIKA